MKEILEFLELIKSSKFEEAKSFLNKLLLERNEDEKVEILRRIFTFDECKIGEGMKLLNLGCGYHYHPSWVNVDFHKTGEHVIAYNLINGIPFEDESFDVVYHSHLLEHFPKRFAPLFLKECYRVLKPGGIIRIVVPDLEQIVRIYLESLEGALQGNEEAKLKYDWILIELFDQMVREKSGGEMLEYWKQYPMPLEDFVLKRLGSEAKSTIENIRKSKQTISPEEYRNRPYQAISDPTELGSFRLSGEIHLWMYDRYSLGKLLEEAGFINIEKVDAKYSKIPNFNSYFLDINPDGSVRKPDSLFMEAQKPAIVTDEEKLKIRISSSKNLADYSNLNNLKVVHLSVWDTHGAGLSALRLHLGLLRIGVDSKMLTVFKSTNYPEIYEAKKKPFALNWKWEDYFANWQSILRKNYPNRPNHFEFFSSVSSITDLKDNQFIKNADIINFHWISSMIDFREDFEIFQGKKIVWTLHDENAYTGGCHYSSGCTKYQYMCKACPQLASNFDNDLSYYQFTTKYNFLRDLDLTVVTPSKWLLGNVNKSFLLRNKPALNIYYGIPIGIFHKYEKFNVREYLKFPQNKFIILSGAEYQTFRKGYHLLKDLFKKIPRSINGKEVELYIFGNISNERIESNLPVKPLGYVGNQIVLAMLYSAADVFLSLSLEDNLPNTAIESICCGTPVVAFNIGGLSDIVEHQVNGWLAKPFEIDDIIKGIEYCSNFTDEESIEFSYNAQRKFNELAQSINYVNLYLNLLNGKSVGDFNRFDGDIVSKFEKFIETIEPSIFLLNHLHLINFSGLDQSYLNKFIKFQSVEKREFLKLLIIRFCFSLEINLTNIILVTTKENIFITELPKIFNFKFVLIDFTSKKIFNWLDQNETVLEIGVDNLKKLRNLAKSKTIFLVLTFDEIKKINSEFVKSLFDLEIEECYLFVDLPIQEGEQIDSHLEKIGFSKSSKIISKMSLDNLGQNDNDYPFLNSLLGESKYIIFKFFPDYIKFESKVKNINFLKYFNKEYPKISIVTPNLNQGKYIENAIRSVVDQNYPNLEYIIIDGGSKDNSVEIIRKYERYFKFWVSEKDNGQYDAINKGFERSTGEILAWINADDFYLPGAFYFVAEFFLAFPEYDWVTTSEIATLSQDLYLDINWGKKEYSLKKILDGKFHSPFIQQESTFWKRSLWEKAGGYVSTRYWMASDLELWMRFFLNSNLCTLDCPLAVFRLQPESKTGRNMDRYMKEGYDLVRYYKDFLGSVNEFSSYSFGNSINVSFIELVSKSGLKITGSQLEKIIQDYENFRFKTRYGKKMLEDWKIKLKILLDLWKKI